MCAWVDRSWPAFNSKPPHLCCRDWLAKSPLLLARNRYCLHQLATSGMAAMYEQRNGKFKFECDGLCGGVIATGMKSWQQALNVSRVEGWDHRRSASGNWLNFCP